ncbi:MAG: hypothetical protein HQK96_01540 [Nitrospirae bacterium]|nr:hypothetical protein [Nitrospirota bacterium]
MQNVTVCDRDDAVIKDGQPSYKLTITIEAVGTGKKVEIKRDLCEPCTGIVVRSIAQRVFLDESKEAGILGEIGCKAAAKKHEKSEKAEKSLATHTIHK